MSAAGGLDYVYLDNPVRMWAVAVITAALALIALRLLRDALVARFSRGDGTGRTFAQDAVLETLRRTRIYFFLAVAIAVATRVLDLPPALRHLIGRGLVLVVLLQIGRWVSYLIGLWVHRFAEQRTLAGDVGSITTVRALGVAAQLLFWLVVTITVLETVFDYDVTALVTGLGIVGIAVALAVQNILGDLLAALSIILDKPFVVGDFIVVGEKRGTIEAIGLKTTRLRALGGEQLVFSNAELLKSTIHNYKRMYERRVVLTFDVHLGTPHGVLAALPGELRRIIEAQSPVRFDRAHVATITDRGFRLEAVYYILDPGFNPHMDLKERIILESLAMLDARGVRLARTMLEEKTVVE